MTSGPLGGLLPPAPRRLSLVVRLQTLFGGFSNLFGWVFFGFGFVFVWAFALQSEPVAAWRFGDSFLVAKGRVTALETTGIENEDERVFALHYEFETGGGADAPGAVEAVEAVAPAERSEGRVFTEDASWAPGDEVTVEYRPDDPRISRVAGERSAPFGAWALVAMVFPLIGLVFLFFGLRASLRALVLFRRGRLASGRLEETRQTNMSINNDMVYECTFAFEDDRGHRRTVRHRTTHPESWRGDAIPLLYDPGNPLRAVPAEGMSGVRVEPGQGFRVENPRKAFLAALPAAVTLLGHGAWILFAYVL